AKNVRVVTWGMDVARFPAPEKGTNRNEAAGRRKKLFFAGLPQEQIKGFDVLQAACNRLWQTRQDFELIATGEPVGPPNEFTRHIGWVSQADLPNHYRDSDITIVPTIAQEGLSRTAVEAMGAARPVIGSRLGGLLDTIVEGVTGVFSEPGNPEDLAA